MSHVRLPRGFVARHRGTGWFCHGGWACNGHVAVRVGRRVRGAAPDLQGRISSLLGLANAQVGGRTRSVSFAADREAVPHFSSDGNAVVFVGLSRAVPVSVAYAGLLDGLRVVAKGKVSDYDAPMLIGLDEDGEPAALVMPMHPAAFRIVKRKAGPR